MDAKNPYGNYLGTEYIISDQRDKPIRKLLNQINILLDADRCADDKPLVPNYRVSKEKAESLGRQIYSSERWAERYLQELAIKQLPLTPTHLGIVMEYTAGGELFEHICNAGRFSEDEF
ncbi:hypothetical protein V2J09_018842 [Rumex salicifolius]